MAKTANEIFRDWLLRHSHYLGRVENGAIREMVAPYQRARQEIYDRLADQAKWTGRTREWRIARLNAQLAEVEGALQAAALDSAGSLQQTLRELAYTEADLQAAMLAGPFGRVGVDIVSLPYAQIEQILDEPLIYQYRGMTPADSMLWGNKKAVDAMRQELTQAVISGEDMARASKRLVNPLTATMKGVAYEQIARRATIIARSEIMHVSNSVSRRVFNENQDVMKGCMYTATLDRRTCLICASDDGRFFPYKDGIDHEGPLLPRHPLCRCCYSPVTKSWTELGADAKTQTGKDYFSGKRPEVITYSDWLKKQPDDVLKEILGPARMKLWKEGKITLSKMATDKKVIAVKDLK